MRRISLASVLVAVAFVTAVNPDARCALGVDECMPRRWTEVRPGWLYRSGQISADDVAEVLREQRIDVVIDLTNEHPDPARAAEELAARDLRIRYVHLPVAIEPEIALRSYARVVSEIALARSRGKRVLVHCELGYRRSAAAVALYLRLIEGASADVAYLELLRYADGTSRWAGGARSFLEQNLPQISAMLDQSRRS